MPPIRVFAGLSKLRLRFSSKRQHFKSSCAASSRQKSRIYFFACTKLCLSRVCKIAVRRNVARGGGRLGRARSRPIRCLRCSALNALKSRTLLTSRWWATEWLPSHPAYPRLCTLLSIPFSEKSRGAQTTGHYLRTVTPDIKADNHDQMQQIAQSTLTNTIGTAIAELALRGM